MWILFLACNPKPKHTCEADKGWITNPSFPTEVAESETFCDFYQFSWQAFLAQTQQAKSPEANAERVFEQNRIYQFGGVKNQCSLPPLLGRKASFDHQSSRVRKGDVFEKIEADSHALYDQNGNILLYNIYYSPQNCKATEKGFVKGTFEIKASWMQLKEPSDKYLTIEEPTGESLAHYGLVGIHFSIWTPRHPEAIWVTWEHKDNAPLCDGSSPVKKYNFASKEAAKCLKKHKSPIKCADFKFNIPHEISPPPNVAAPINVCREYALGNQHTASINGNDTNANKEAIEQLNKQLVGEKGLLTSLHLKDPMRVWSNYQMVGALWTKDGQASGSLPVAHNGGEPNPNSPQRGSLELTNMSMETFQQGDDSYVPNCFGCHGYKPEQPLSVSHIQQDL